MKKITILFLLLSSLLGQAQRIDWVSIGKYSGVAKSYHGTIANARKSQKNVYPLDAADTRQAGTLNNQFSQNGWDASIYGNNNGFYINKTLVQPDGKILVCAEGYYSSAATQAVVVRYNKDGSFDNTFGGGDGMVRSKDDAAINLWTHANGMGLQSTGKIIIAGDAFGTGARIFRLNADGSLDPSFAKNGVINRPRTNAAFIYHVGIQSDNKIIVCGEESRLINGVLEPHVFLWRFTENGSLDTSFGTAGVVSYHSTTWLNAAGARFVLNDLIILPDDKIIINQSFSKATDASVLLRKFNANGSSDTSFGTNGEAMNNVIGTDVDYKYSSSALQKDGSIISSISSRNENNNTYSESIYRIDTQGKIDSSFNINLKNPTHLPETLQLKVFEDKIYIIKKADQNAYSFDKIICYDLSGNLVKSFGINGALLLNQNNIPQSYSNKAAISSEGAIYLISNTIDPNNSANTLFLALNVTGFNPNLSNTESLAPNIAVVYPNPTTGTVTLSNTKNVIFEKVELMDSLGKLIFVTTENTSELDFRELSSGIYIVKMYSDTHILQKKVIKQ